MYFKQIRNSILTSVATLALSPQHVFAMEEIGLDGIPVDIRTLVARRLPPVDAGHFGQTSRSNKLTADQALHYLKSNGVTHFQPGISIEQITEGKITLLRFQVAQALAEEAKTSEQKELENAKQKWKESGDAKSACNNELAGQLSKDAQKSDEAAIQFQKAFEKHNETAQALLEESCMFHEFQAIHKKMYLTDTDNFNLFIDTYVNRGNLKALTIKRDALVSGQYGYGLLVGQHANVDFNYEEARKINDLLIEQGSLEAKNWKRQAVKGGLYEYDLDLQEWKDLTEELADRRYPAALSDRLRGYFFGENGYEKNSQLAKNILKSLSFEEGTFMQDLRRTLIWEEVTPKKSKVIRLLNNWCVRKGDGEAIQYKLRGLLLGENAYDVYRDAAIQLLKSLSSEEHQSAVYSLIVSLMSNDGQTSQEVNKTIQFLNDWLVEKSNGTAILFKLRGLLLGENTYEVNLNAATQLLNSLSDELGGYVTNLRDTLKYEDQTPEKSAAIRFLNDWLVEKNNADGIIFKLRGVILGEYPYEINPDAAPQLLNSISSENEHYIQVLRETLKNEENQTPEKGAAIRHINDWLIEKNNADGIHYKLRGLLLGENGYEMDLEAAIRLLNSLSSETEYYIQILRDTLKNEEATQLLNSLSNELEGYMPSLRDALKSEEQTPEKSAVIRLLNDWLVEKSNGDGIQFKIQGLLLGEDGYEVNFDAVTQWLKNYSHTHNGPGFTEVLDLRDIFMSLEDQTLEESKAIRFLNDWSIENHYNAYPARKTKFLGLLFGENGYEKNPREAMLFLLSQNWPQKGYEKFLDLCRQNAETLEEGDRIEINAVLNEFFPEEGLEHKVKALLSSEVEKDRLVGQSTLELLSKYNIEWVQRHKIETLGHGDTARKFINKLIKDDNDWAYEYKIEGYAEGKYGFEKHPITAKELNNAAIQTFGDPAALKRKMIGLNEGKYGYKQNPEKAEKFERDFKEKWEDRFKFEPWDQPETVQYIHEEPVEEKPESEVPEVIVEEDIHTKFLSLIKGEDGELKDLYEANLLLAQQSEKFTDVDLLARAYADLGHEPHTDVLRTKIVDKMMSLKMERSKIQEMFSAFLTGSYGTADKVSAYQFAVLTNYLPDDLR